MALAKWEADTLTVIAERLRSLCSPGKDGAGCAVADEHKEAVRLYVQTWILPPLVDVLASEPEHSRMMGKRAPRGGN